MTDGIELHQRTKSECLADLPGEAAAVAAS
jgi:hypothetical protein